MRTFSIEESGAFVNTQPIEPTRSGPLDGLTFAIKDLFDTAGDRTSAGNPAWQQSHPPAVAHSVTVSQLLDAGARALGKTVTDELAFSLIGENHFFGTPLNPAAPDRVPGGSSSGSASAVACGIVDFALGTDTGGSVRVPASNCGILGYRPSHGWISLAGVAPLASSMDTVGIFARIPDVIARVVEVLVGGEVPAVPSEPDLICLADILPLLDEDAKQGFAQGKAKLESLYPGRVRDASLADVLGEAADDWIWRSFSAFYEIQLAEIWSTHGAWVEAMQPAFGPTMLANMDLARKQDRSRLPAAIRDRNRFRDAWRRYLDGSRVLCLPTAVAPAPRKGEFHRRDTPLTYIRRCLCLTSLAGVGRLCQVSLPLLRAGEFPLGLSLVAGHGQDFELLAIARQLMERW